MNQSNIRTVCLQLAKYDKSAKTIYMSSSIIGMPAKFLVKSHITGKVIEFSVVTPDDPLFDQDHWDGEMCVYRPQEYLDTVECMVIANSL